MATKQKLVERLQELQNVDYTNSDVSRASNVKADKVLNSIFQAGRKRVDFTEDEKRQIGNLIIDVIKPIKINIVSTGSRDRSRLDTSVLMKRSALQFLVEDYGQFPARDTSLLNELEKANVKESIKILDDLIEYWRDLSDSDEGKTDPEDAGASDMPGTHTWWSQ